MRSQPLKKLTARQVSWAIRSYKEGSSLQDIAVRLKVSRQSMWDLLRRRIILRPQKRIGTENNFFRGGAFSDGKCHDKIEKALLSGKIKRGPCEKCGESGFYKNGRSKVEAHHDDYNKPMSVRWLCRTHHHEWHKNNSAKRRTT